MGRQRPAADGEGTRCPDRGGRGGARRLHRPGRRRQPAGAGRGHPDRRPVRPQPAARHRHPGHPGRRDGAGRAAGRRVPGGVADEPGGRRRAGPGARGGGGGQREVDQRGRGGPAAMRWALTAVLATGSLLLAGCGDDGTEPAAAAGTGGLSGPVVVFAAASLTESFGTLGERFEAAHPGVRVRFNFGPSSGLAQSIAQGAPADVFASAGATSMRSVVDRGDAADPRTFATNVLQIAVPRDNPAAVATLADLAEPGVAVAVCQEQVPCGTLARTVLDKAGLAVTPVTFGADVKAVLTAVRLGEVDAGLVYRTDVRAAGPGVRGIAIPAARNGSTSYPIATLTGAPNRAAAAAFVDYVLSAEGQAVLADAGFAAP